jgi:hypothetical protein
VQVQYRCRTGTETVQEQIRDRYIYVECRYRYSIGIVRYRYSSAVTTGNPCKHEAVPVQVQVQYMYRYRHSREQTEGDSFRQYAEQIQYMDMYTNSNSTFQYVNSGNGPQFR